MGILARYIFITDLHIGGSHSSRSGNPLDDVLKKLEYCVGFANKTDARLLIGGDVFDKHVVSQEALNRTMDVLSCCAYTPYCVWGNHDMLYRQPQNNHKCSLYSLGAAGLVEFIDGKGKFDVDGKVWITNEQYPEPPAGVAFAIGMYHAFLGIPDGSFSVDVSNFAQVQTPMLVLLGHDHTVYPAESFGPVVFVRGGSLFRDCRGEQSERTPAMVCVAVRDDRGDTPFSMSLVELPSDVARPYEGLFKDVSVLSEVPEDEEQGGNFDALMEELSHESGAFSDLSFEQALSSSTDDGSVCEYCKVKLAEAKRIKK